MTRLERHRWLAAGLLAVFALAIVGAAPVLAAAKARNVIVLIADGCSSRAAHLRPLVQGRPALLRPLPGRRDQDLHRRLGDRRLGPGRERLCHGGPDQRQVHQRGSEPEHPVRGPAAARGDLVQARGHRPGGGQAPEEINRHRRHLARDPRHPGRLHCARALPRRRGRHHGAGRAPGHRRGVRRRQAPPGAQGVQGAPHRRRQPLRASEKLGLPDRRDPGANAEPRIGPGLRDVCRQPHGPRDRPAAACTRTSRPSRR